jgi:hypothetical protein
LLWVGGFGVPKDVRGGKCEAEWEAGGESGRWKGGKELGGKVGGMERTSVVLSLLGGFPSAPVQDVGGRVVEEVQEAGARPPEGVERDGRGWTRML